MPVAIPEIGLYLLPNLMELQVLELVMLCYTL